MAKPLAADVLRPVDTGKARVELRLLVTAAEREIVFDRQAAARRLADGRRHRFAPRRGPVAPGFEVAHAPSPARRPPRTFSQNRLLPRSLARLRSRRLTRTRAR